MRVVLRFSNKPLGTKMAGANKCLGGQGGTSALDPARHEIVVRGPEAMRGMLKLTAAIQIRPARHPGAQRGDRDSRKAARGESDLQPMLISRLSSVAEKQGPKANLGFEGAHEIAAATRGAPL